MVRLARTRLLIFSTRDGCPVEETITQERKIPQHLDDADNAIVISNWQ